LNRFFVEVTVTTQRFLALIRVTLAVVMIIFSGLVFLQVLVRYVFDFGIFGLNDVTSLIAVWMYFLGASYAAYTNEHISASLVDVVFPADGRTAAVISTVACFLTAVVMLVFAWWSTQYVMWAFDMGAISDELKLPRTVFAVPISLGCLMMAVFFARLGFRSAVSPKRQCSENGENDV
jgi:TRAP-type C4-dicarboxylate transport system permease small subunit